MFSECDNLTTLDLHKFKTENATDMSYMFYKCINIKNIKLFNNTKNVNNMCYMFYHCNNLSNINLSSFDTNKVKDMHSMFESCKNLTSLDLSSFNTENVSNINNMFANCENLKSLNLFSFDINHVNNGMMFPGCKQLENIKIKKNQIQKIKEFLEESKIENKIKYD